MTSKASAVFLDRDGVLIENRMNYVRSWTDVEFLPGTFDALHRLARTDYKVVIVTNQSAIGRGIITLSEANLINQRILDEITSNGGRIDEVMMCPHAPNEGCSCRKPQPGMILQANDRMSISLSTSILIGDTINDLLAGQAAGIPDLALVRTGLGASEEPELAFRGPKGYLVFDHLEKALDHLIFNDSC